MAVLPFAELNICYFALLVLQGNDLTTGHRFTTGHMFTTAHMFTTGHLCCFFCLQGNRFHYWKCGKWREMLFCPVGFKGSRLHYWACVHFCLQGNRFHHWKCGTWREIVYVFHLLKCYSGGLYVCIHSISPLGCFLSLERHADNFASGSRQGISTQWLWVPHVTSNGSPPVGAVADPTTSPAQEIRLFISRGFGEAGFCDLSQINVDPGL